jgi:hypothetical protein
MMLSASAVLDNALATEPVFVAITARTSAASASIRAQIGLA